MSTMLRSLLAVLVFALGASACTHTGYPTESLRQMRTFDEASDQIGNTYTASQTHAMHACDGGNCVDRNTGSFTIDNAAQVVGQPLILMHVVFDDGQARWMSYEDFRMQNFTSPVTTRLHAKLGMSSNDIRKEWGAPDRVAPGTASGATVEQWTYKNAGTLSFEDGKLVELALAKSLLAAK